MSTGKHLTAKGQRTAARVLEAATTVLARDGFGGATLGRIAEEAGLDKRNVLYYYDTREALLVRVVQTVGERVAGHIEETVGEIDTPEALADALVEAMWSGITSAPELARSYFALIGGGAGTPEVEAALRGLKDAYERLISRQLQSISHTRWRLRDDLPGMVTLTLAVFRGLLLEWTETGDTAASAASLQRLKRSIAAEYVQLG
ncbi:TetR/AcrR family transcriptional regulator [Paraconexibacter antarcticus]|uniref:TetR/AcrR family transcriptional regulator n=1 Tax=Paraconexibacter antarcticus TaxID=2949664 RepID=A0ABY5DMP0_9ACTN|nr:TetR/AcrR family transcriptional regulator [Paraconexibacter antarcticus]UTI63243.1 TetR/AcrR family transcriptional regulator [Paraconexibacter antarcticus]UTI66759.1 TetR/AcrR family transcriptional regulator [Paraconexibacter antarcticus]